jgi:hypothetical protein
VTSTDLKYLEERYAPPALWMPAQSTGPNAWALMQRPPHDRFS